VRTPLIYPVSTKISNEEQEEEVVGSHSLPLRLDDDKDCLDNPQN